MGILGVMKKNEKLLINHMEREFGKIRCSVPKHQEILDVFSSQIFLHQNHREAQKILF